MRHRLAFFALLIPFLLSARISKEVWTNKDEVFCGAVFSPLDDTDTLGRPDNKWPGIWVRIGYIDTMIGHIRGGADTAKVVTNKAGYPGNYISAWFKGDSIWTDRWLEHGTNTFIGNNVCGGGNLTHNSGDEGRSNTFYGYAVGHDITTGYFNTFSGVAAGYSITTGYGNTFNGIYSGYKTTEGYENTFLGRLAGYENLTGHRSLYAGFSAGYNATGDSNIFIGPEAGFYETGSSKFHLGNQKYTDLDSAKAKTILYGVMASQPWNQELHINSDIYTDFYLNSTTNTFLGVGVAGVGNLTAGGIHNTFTGYQAGYSNTTGTCNLFSGYQAGRSNTTGRDNVFLGDSAGYSNTTGYENTFTGERTGSQNTTGFANTFTGFYAGRHNTTGRYNTFTGHWAGINNTDGHYNTFTGYHTGTTNTTGDNNTFMGYEAGNFNTTGHDNVFSGHRAGYSNTTGSYNTFSGYWAGYKNTTSAYNTFTGANAGYNNTTGANNTFTGADAGINNTTGHDNIFLGYQAGYLNATGNYNLFLGERAGYSNTAGSNNIILGQDAGYNTTGHCNTFIGRAAGNTYTTGDSSVFLGGWAGFYETGSNTFILDNRQRTNEAIARQEALIYGIFAADPANQDLILHADVGINTADPDRKLDVSDANGPAIRWTHTDNTHYGEAEATSTGKSVLHSSIDSTHIVGQTMLDSVTIGNGTPIRKVVDIGSYLGFIMTDNDTFYAHPDSTFTGPTITRYETIGSSNFGKNPTNPPVVDIYGITHVLEHTVGTDKSYYKLYTPEYYVSGDLSIYVHWTRSTTGGDQSGEKVKFQLKNLVINGTSENCNSGENTDVIQDRYDSADVNDQIVYKTGALTIAAAEFAAQEGIILELMAIAPTDSTMTDPAVVAISIEYLGTK